MSDNQGDASYRDTLESVRKCFDGLCLYAAREAALGRDASNIRGFALDMAAFCRSRAFKILVKREKIC